MDIDQAANFLAGSVLIGIGFIVICTVIIVINNLFSRYWKSIEWSFPEYRFIEPGSKREPK